MSQKDDSITEIKARIAGMRVAAGINTFRYAPTTAVELGDCPTVFMIEGLDEIVKRNSRSSLGPHRRLCEIVIELVAEKDDNGMPDTIKSIFRQVRSVVLSNIHPLPDVTSVFMQEARSEGPMGYGIPNALIMRLVLDLMYDE